MRYISDIEFKNALAGLLLELSKTKDPKQQRKLQDEINALKKERNESTLSERFMSMKRR